MTKRLSRRRLASVAVVATMAAAAALSISGAQAGTKGTHHFTHHSAGTPRVVSRTAVAFHDAMRKLWEDHITWTRNVIISFEVNDPDPNEVLPDLNAALGRLLQNQADIGNAIKPFYGDAAGDQLTALLREHILIAGEILQDVKTGDTTALADAQQRWYANAHDIAVFLNAANPRNWPLDEMDQMMKNHLDATTREVVARATENWDADVAAYDDVHEQALEMADMLSDGIIAQFPKRFRP
jgi:hypothetical protein